MKSIRPKDPRVKLDDECYQALHRQILQRDNWRCQSCGGMSNLHVHHITYRSHSGGDFEPNLITLCATCHSRQHSR